MHLVFLPKINSFELVMGNFYWTYILDKVLIFLFLFKKEIQITFLHQILRPFYFMLENKCQVRDVVWLKKKLRCGSQQSLKELNIPRNYKINKQIKGAWWKWMMY